MIIDIFVRKISEPDLENEFISIFLLFYLVFITAFLNLLNEKKTHQYFSVEKWFSVLKNEVYNRNSEKKNYFIYLLSFLFVWFLFVVLLLNTELLKHTFDISSSRLYSYLLIWSLGIGFFFVKSFFILIIGNVFAVPKTAYSYGIIDFKVWLFYSLIIYPIVGVQIYSSISISDDTVFGLFIIPLLIILSKKIIFLFSVKEYSWFIKLLYLCVLEILVYFICIKLIVSNL